MSILNALKSSAVFAGFATVLLAGAAEAASLFDGTISTGSPNSPFDTNLIDGFIETTGNTSPEITFDAEVGDILTFDFKFTSGESAINPLFKDGASFALNGETTLLADVTEMGSVSVTIDTAGQNTLSFSAFNAISDTLFFPVFPADDNEISELFISNVAVSGAQAVPEPASMLGLIAVAALGSSSLLKRKQS